jgi:phage-related protein
MTPLPLPNKIIGDVTHSVKFRVIQAEFGDGYSQVAPKGLNSQYSNYSITWAPVTREEKDTIISTLNSVGAWGILTWTPCLEETQKKFRMTPDGYNFQWLGSSNVYSVSCELKQVFDIA